MANPKKGTSQARNEFIWGWAFILPTMLGLIILNIYPIFKTIYESFFKYFIRISIKEKRFSVRKAGTIIWNRRKDR